MTASITPSHFWANWDPTSASPHIIRRDTRIFWHPQSHGTLGQCVGSFMGENPGGAESIFGLTYSGYSPLTHNGAPGDPTLRFIYGLWKEAVENGLPLPAGTDFIEVLNTYYFRNPSSGESLASWRAMQGSTLYSPQPSRSSRFVLLGWGVEHTHSPEALACARSLSHCQRVIIPRSSGDVSVVSGHTLANGVSPGPPMPSYVMRQGKQLKPVYTRNVIREFR